MTIDDALGRVKAIPSLNRVTRLESYAIRVILAELERLQATNADLREALRNFLSYYDQAGIGDAAEVGDDFDGTFDGDERFNVRAGRVAIAKATTGDSTPCP